MAQQTSKFFTTKTIKGDVRCFIRGEQACTIYRDKADKQFYVMFVRANKPDFTPFQTFAQADHFAYANWC